MTRLIDKALALATILFLSACVAGPGQVQPGLGSGVNQDQLVPPSGTRYDFELMKSGETMPLTMSLVSKRLSANRYRYNGGIFVPLPDNDPTLAAFTVEVLQELFGDPNIRQSGDKIVVPLRMETDRRFRSTRSNFLFEDMRFAPHDCFAQIGTCRSTVSSLREKAEVETVTTESGGIWHSEARPISGMKIDGSERRLMTYSLDQNGVLLDAKIVTSEKGTTETFTIRRISPR